MNEETKKPIESTQPASEAEKDDPNGGPKDENPKPDTGGGEPGGSIDSTQ